ncbi:hypothetical protein [uncultured phage_MedDCM-OCT-S28-C3]|uniref:Bacteriophage T7 tail fibre protein-like N-terminal domain-containing protein n=1 Tax=uncultured phage_MedDCM-OCT-S28-C3 TaxID=2740802 RepID=A0A6S4P8C9_9CAUD|nr:hypothetical protein HOQ59_gp35 [uncultured phage_MedDCM-OCT-S28-C3]BAQ94029.1 hypothetical protein [uncultured phage_MedDCM-OCT-S28-C3]
MAVTQNSFTGNGSTTNFSFTFPYIKEADVKAKIDGVNTTAFTLANATTVSFTSAPASGAAIIIFRDTDNDEKTATFFAGSAVKAEDLNSNFDQVLFTAQEVDNNALQTLGGTMSGDLSFGQNADIIFEGTTDDANETTLTVTDPTADRTITLPDVTGTVVTTGDTGTVATAMVADSAITSAKISDGTIATGDIADDAITTAKIADANVTTALIADANVTTAKLASDAVTTAKITDANVTTAKIANDAITAAKIAADAVGSSEIAANAVTSSELADASVDTAAIVDANVTTVKVADAAITTAKINDSAVTSAKIGSNQVTEAKIADNAVTTAKIPDSGVTTPKIADNAVTNVKLADAELRELATMGSTTASALADLTQTEVQILDGATVSTSELNILDGVTANATEINQLDGNTLTNSFTASSTTQYPSSNAISGYVLGLMDNLGGFVAIANENSFPTTNPDPSDDAGTVVSISDAGGLVVSASGTASGQTTGGTAVTITGFPSALQSSTLPAGQGLQVVSTSTLNTYTYHKVLGTDADIAQLNDDVNDFFARYRIGSSNPTTDLDAGDLFFNTSTGKMLVYDDTVSAWEEVQAVGNYFINTLSSSGGTGGGSATFNGSAYRFTLSNPGSVAQQHIVSINGVIQKPNSGTSQPSEGFAIDNADIILAAAPATGSEFFIVTVGTSVNIGTPSNDTITNAMVKADAAIAGTKISPNFGSQNVVTTGSVGIGTSSADQALSVQGLISTKQSNGTTRGLIGSPSWDGSKVAIQNGTLAQSYTNAALHQDATGNTVVNSASGGATQFAIGGGEKARIDSSGSLGLGTSSPATDLHIHDSSGSGSSEILLTNGDTGATAADGFKIALNSGEGGEIWNYENDYIRFGTNNTERMRIDSEGKTTVQGSGTSNNPFEILTLKNTETSSSGQSIQINLETNRNSQQGISKIKSVASDNSGTALLQFNSSQYRLKNQADTSTYATVDSDGLKFNGDTAAANALDDYEEGTWTANLQSSNDNATRTVGNTTGYYVKVGTMCTAYYYTQGVNCTNAGTGTAVIRGLPFTSANLSNGFAVCTITHATVFASRVQNGYVNPNTTHLVFIGEESTSGVALVAAGTRYLMVSMTYRTE